MWPSSGSGWDQPSTEAPPCFVDRHLKEVEEQFSLLFLAKLNVFHI